jgi:hypothetical protein
LKADGAATVVGLLPPHPTPPPTHTALAAAARVGFEMAGCDRLAGAGSAGALTHRQGAVRQEGRQLLAVDQLGGRHNIDGHNVGLLRWA